MRILVTGLGGFLGKAVGRLLAKEKHQILGFIQKSSSLDVDCPNFFFHKCDLREPNSYKKEIAQFAPQILVHLAWKGIPDFSMVNCLDNIQMSIDLVDAVVASGSCRKILVAGSCFEYDQLIGACFEENLGKPKDSFTWAKHSLLSYLNLVCQKNHIILGWMRPFYIYGPNQRSGSLIPTVFSALKEKRLPDLRTPKNSNDFVYVDDVACGFSLAVEKEIPSGIYNLGSGVVTSVSDICELAENLVTGGRSLTDELKSRTKETNQSCAFWADCSRSEKFLGWKATTSLNEGVRLYQDSIS